MHVLEAFKHEETFNQMIMSDKLLATGYVIILGMGITFIALVLIWWITVLMSKTIQKIEAKNAIVEVKPQMTQPLVTSAQNVAQIEDEEELIAVISAAIAASLNTSMENFKVTNIRRLSDSTPTWGKIGRSDVMNARF